MTSFELYLDESGTNEAAEYIYIAGCMMWLESWTMLTKNWARVLSNYELARFRASDCEAAQGDFLGWSRDERDTIFLRLTDEVEKVDYVISRIGIHKQLFDSVAAKYPLVDVTLYEFGVIWCVKIGGLLPKIFKSEESLKIIFEKGQKVRSHVRNYITGISNRSDYPITSFDFRPKNEHIPFQVADLIAWEYHKYTESALEDSGKPVRPSLKALTRYPERHISKDYNYSSQNDLELEFQLLSDCSPNGFKPPSKK